MNVMEPILMVFISMNCTKCFSMATELDKLATLTMDRPKIVRAVCDYDREPCDLFVNHMKDLSFPYIMMLEPGEKKGYVYNGDLTAEAISSKFLEKSAFKDFPTHGGRGYTLKKCMEAGRELINRNIKEDLSKNAN